MNKTTDDTLGLGDRRARAAATAGGRRHDGRVTGAKRGRSLGARRPRRGRIPPCGRWC
ncbi:MAG: hypothetical protein MZV65_38155 [Chromatiales bacterium]|nr:hypothetical protein [Chromatiales bacterium]